MKRREFRVRDGVRVASYIGKFPLEKRVRGDELAEGIQEVKLASKARGPGLIVCLTAYWPSY